jgi:hypothetical protein
MAIFIKLMIARKQNEKNRKKEKKNYVDDIFEELS